MQEKDALPEAPQRSRAELVAAGASLGNVIRQTCTHVMDFYVREQVGGSVAQTKRQFRSLRGEGRRMAKGAADGAKEPAAVSDRGCASRRGGGGRGLVQELHERIEQPDVTGDGGGCGAIGVSNVLGVADPSEVQAAGRKPASQLVLTRQRPILRKQFVGDAHFHVVSLTGEDHQRLVLGLPAKTADGAIVSVVIERTADAKTIVCLGRAIGPQGRVVNVCHQSRSKHRCGNAEDDVVCRPRSIKAGLLQAAAAGVSPTGDREKVFYSPVGCVRVGIAELVKEEWEPCFADRAIGVDEIWDSVGVAIYEPVGDHLALGVRSHIGEDTGGGASSARGRLRMTRPARVHVEPWSQTWVVSG